MELANQNINSASLLVLRYGSIFVHLSLGLLLLRSVQKLAEGFRLHLRCADTSALYESQCLLIGELHHSVFGFVFIHELEIEEILGLNNLVRVIDYDFVDILGKLWEVFEVFSANLCSHHRRLLNNLSAHISDSNLVESEVFEDLEVSILGRVDVIEYSELLFAQDLHDVPPNIQDTLMRFDLDVLGAIEN